MSPDPPPDIPAAVGFDLNRDLLLTGGGEDSPVSMNSAWESILGWSRAELLAMRPGRIVHPEDAGAVTAAVENATRGSFQVADLQVRLRTRWGSWRWFSWSAHSDGRDWIAVGRDVTEGLIERRRLRELLAPPHLLAYGQAIHDFSTGEHVRDELLVRLRPSEPGQEVLTPGEFLPQAERFGLVGEVDRWMVARGIEMAAAGRRAAVNLSARSIADPALTAELIEGIEGLGDAAANLVVEITETAAIEQLTQARRFTDTLVGLGCRFALDDFGTGFGSLTYLRHLPIEMLKIDVGFVRDLRRHPQDRMLIRGIVAIAREFGLITVAEGVEDRETFELLADYGVDEAQGYHLGRPRPMGWPPVPAAA